MKTQGPSQDISTDPRPPEDDANAGQEPGGLYRLGFSYGHLIYRFRWIILALWLIGLVISIPFVSKVGDVLSGGVGGYKASESAQADALLKQKLHITGSQVLAVFQAPQMPVSASAYQGQLQDFTARAQHFPHVKSVINGGAGTDGKTAYLIVNFTLEEGAVEDQVDDFSKAVSTQGPAHVYLTGAPVIYHELSTATLQDVEHAEVVALPIALLVLLIVFGTLVAALMPLLLALVALPVALAIIYGIALHLQISIYVLNVASIIGLGISIDYSLFVVRRFRDELHQGRTVYDAIAWTIATAGEAILFSGMTVMLGFLGLLLLGVPFMSGFGIGGAMVVLCSVLAALTLLPALLSILGTRINALRIPLLSRLVMARAQHSEQRGFWRTWALGVMKRPILITLVVCALLVALGWPILSINLGSSSGLPANFTSQQGLTILQQQFPATNGHPVEVVVRSPDGSSILTASNLQRIASYTQWLAAQPHVTAATSLTQFSAPANAAAPTTQQLIALYSSGAYQQNPALAQLVASTTGDDTTLITLKTDAPLDSITGKDLINHLRSDGHAQRQGLTVLIGGDQASDLDDSNYLYGNFPRAIAFILIATYILLLLMFRSVLLPLKALLMNVLSLSAAYGVLVAVFQWGDFAQFLGFKALGFLDSIIPVLLFCILFGLSMDYEVFLLSRIHEEWLRTYDNRRAVALGLEKTGGVITNAALLFVIVTGSFIFTSIVITKEMGLGMTVAVLVDATIIRSLLVPATMRLLGRFNWWFPGRALPAKK